MKNKIRSAVALLLVTVMCLTLCSCYQLDDMKAQQSFYLNDFGTEVTFGGNEYKMLTLSHEMWLDADEGVYGYVTDKDVPVLLSGIFGHFLSSYNDGKFIQVNGETYCKKALYDHYSELARNSILDKYCYVKYYQIDDYKKYGMYLKIVTDETAEVLEKILETKPRGIESDVEFSAANLEHNLLYEIYRCDETGLFYKEYAEVCTVDGYQGYFIKKLTSDAVNHFYRIPEQYVVLFYEIMEDISSDV